MDIREAVKKVKLCLTRIREIEKAVAEMRIEQEARQSSSYGMPRSGRIGDPTAQKALRQMEPIRGLFLSDGTYIEYPEGWITVYKESLRFFTYLEARQVLQKRFVERKSVERSLLDIGCLSRKTLFSIQDQIIYFSLGVAEGLGLLDDLKASSNQNYSKPA